jgi:methylmalonyl-CoA epimerase
MKIKRISHIGILVSGMESALRLYTDELGLRLQRRVAYQGVADIAFLPVEATELEIIADLPPAKEVSSLIAEKGEGVHHIAFEVDNIREAMNELKDRGIPFRDPEPKPGAHGTLTAFMDPRATHGVLIELVQVGL